MSGFRSQGLGLPRHRGDDRKGLHGALEGSGIWVPSSSPGTDSAAWGAHICAVHPLNGQNPREQKVSLEVMGRRDRLGCL